jgi:hypothetical protein
MENSGKQNPKMGFKAPPEYSRKRATFARFRTYPRERIRENAVQGFCVVRLADFFAM